MPCGIHTWLHVTDTLAPRTCPDLHCEACEFDRLLYYFARNQSSSSVSTRTHMSRVSVCVCECVLLRNVSISHNHANCTFQSSLAKWLPSWRAVCDGRPACVGLGRIAAHVSACAPSRACAVRALPVCVILLLFTDCALSREVCSPEISANP